MAKEEKQGISKHKNLTTWAILLSKYEERIFPFHQEISDKNRLKYISNASVNFPMLNPSRTLYLWAWSNFIRFLH